MCFLCVFSALRWTRVSSKTTTYLSCYFNIAVAFSVSLLIVSGHIWSLETLPDVVQCKMRHVSELMALHWPV